MLREFIVSNREKIIHRARERAVARAAPKSTDSVLEHGVPTLLAQIVEALAAVSLAPQLHLVGAEADTAAIADTAALHGHELLRNGMTVGEVVSGYGDVCHVVTELAGEADLAMSAQEFQAFNGCLDAAIAGAVTAYVGQREKNLAYNGTERLGVAVHEMRNLLHTMTLSLAVIRDGKVGFGGSTGAVLVRSMAGLSALGDRLVAQVRLSSGVVKLQPISMLEFMEEMQISAALHAAGDGFRFKMEPVAHDLMVNADWPLLASAVSSLLQNAFKFTRTNGFVSLSAHGTEDRVLIEIRDQCGGLPPGGLQHLFRPFTEESVDRPGFGLGLSIALSAARANGGDFHVRDVPGTGCVFTIDLPRALPRSRPPSIIPQSSR